MKEHDRHYEIRAARIEAELHRLDEKYINAEEYTIEIHVLHDFAREKLRTFFFDLALKTVASDARSITILADELRKNTNAFFRLVSADEKSAAEIEKRYKAELKKLSNKEKRHEKRNGKRSRKN